MTRLSRCPGCGLLVATATGRCSACQRKWDKQYDANRPAHHALYRTAAWRRLAAEVTAGETRCHWCLMPTRKLVADHVVPLEQRPDLALARSNLVAACVGCNTKRGRNAKLPDLEVALPARPDDIEVPPRGAFANSAGAAHVPPIPLAARDVSGGRNG